MVIRDIAFRVDATSRIGSGHFMRCLTLADALKQRGAHIRFVSRDMPDNLRDMLIKKDMEFAALGSETAASVNDDLVHSFWLGVSQQQDAQATLQALSDRIWDWLVVDHYALDCRWESLLRDVAGNILVIDDLADRRHDCDMLLDQNYYGEMDLRYNELVPKYCKKLLGTRYTMLRPEFSAALSTLRVRSGKINRILVFFGATDSQNETLKALKAIRLLGCSEIAVDVILGVEFRFKSEVMDFVESMPEKVTCYNYVNNMAELISASDLYIGAAGTTTWERCCLGLPSLVIAVAENQIRPMKRMAEAGAVMYLGESKDVSVEAVAAVLGVLRFTPEHLLEMSHKCMKLVDGHGADRCVLELFNYGGMDEEAIQDRT